MVAAFLPHRVKISKGFNKSPARLHPWLLLGHGLTQCFQSAADCLLQTVTGSLDTQEGLAVLAGYCPRSQQLLKETVPVPCLP